VFDLLVSSSWTSHRLARVEQQVSKVMRRIHSLEAHLDHLTAINRHN